MWDKHWGTKAALGSCPSFTSSLPELTHRLLCSKRKGFKILRSPSPRVFLGRAKYPEKKDIGYKEFPPFFKFYFRAKQQSRTRTPSTEQNQASQQRPSPSSRSLGTAGFSQLCPFFLLEKPLRIVGKDEIRNQSSNFIFRLLNPLFGGFPSSKPLGNTTRTPELHEGIPG